MISNVLVLLSTYQALHLMITTHCVPTSKVPYINKENVHPRILTRSNGTNREQLLDSIINSQNIIFPDAFQLLYESHLGIHTTPQCATKDAQFCEDFEAYPHKHLNHVLIRTNRHHSEFFGTDQEPIEIANRQGEPEEVFICPSTVKTIFPKVGKNKDDKWRFIINQGEEEGVHVQGLKIETCTKLNEPCNLLGDTPFGYVTNCKQKYVLRRLLSVSDHGQPIPDTFQIPSACCCSFRKDVSVLTTESGRSSARSRKRRRRR